MQDSIEGTSRAKFSTVLQVPASPVVNQSLLKRQLVFALGVWLSLSCRRQELQSCSQLGAASTFWLAAVADCKRPYRANLAIAPYKLHIRRHQLCLVAMAVEDVSTHLVGESGPWLTAGATSSCMVQLGCLGLLQRGLAVLELIGLHQT